ncbi:MAG: hypothetical protein ACFB0C_25090 [Leptolyngbyaceae cyanobacterium]
MASLREQWQTQRQQRLENADQRRQAVQAHLQILHRDRLQNVAQLRDQLSQGEQHRHAQAQHTQAVLAEYTADLQATVQQMQAQLQEERIALHLEAEALRASQRQQRTTAGQALQQDLAAYVASLQTDVADHLTAAENFLAELSLQRQQVTAENRSYRQQEMEALFAEFAQFRQQLIADRANLQQLVWGNQPAPNHQPVAKAQPGKNRRPKTPAPVANPEPVPEVSIEERVYNYVQAQTSGARLTAIESGLKINRFQAVDALRSLIQKELVIQKDRTYYIHEDPVS